MRMVIIILVIFMFLGCSDDKKELQQEIDRLKAELNDYKLKGKISSSSVEIIPTAVSLDSIQNDFVVIEDIHKKRCEIPIKEKVSTGVLGKIFNNEQEETRNRMEHIGDATCTFKLWGDGNWRVSCYGFVDGMPLQTIKFVDNRRFDLYTINTWKHKAPWSNVREGKLTKSIMKKYIECLQRNGKISCSTTKGIELVANALHDEYCDYSYFRN